MITVLAFALLVAALPTTEYSAWIKSDEVHVRFSDLTRLYGPMKFYISKDSAPAAGLACTACPDGVPAEFVVPPEAIYQRWPEGGQYVEATFPISMAGNLEYFHFTAVTCAPTGERYLGSGLLPTLRVVSSKRAR